MGKQISASCNLPQPAPICLASNQNETAIDQRLSLSRLSA